jgi:hypothetical protein
VTGIAERLDIGKLAGDYPFFPSFSFSISYEPRLLPTKMISANIIRGAALTLLSAIYFRREQDADLPHSIGLAAIFAYAIPQIGDYGAFLREESFISRRRGVKLRVLEINYFALRHQAAEESTDY